MTPGLGINWQGKTTKNPSLAPQFCKEIEKTSKARSRHRKTDAGRGCRRSCESSGFRFGIRFPVTRSRQWDLSYDPRRAGVLLDAAAEGTGRKHVHATVTGLQLDGHPHDGLEHRSVEILTAESGKAHRLLEDLSLTAEKK